MEPSDNSRLVDEIERNLWETWSNWGRGPECELHDEENVLWFETPLPIIPYNGVLKFSVKDNARARIGQITEQFGARKVPFIWVVHPSSSPADLTRQLVERGLKDVEPIFGMARELSYLPEIPPVPDGIEVRKVTDESDAGAFVQFAAWRWNIPDEYGHTYAGLVSQYGIGKPKAKAHMWQAWRDNQPVAKAGMYLGSGSAGIYAVVTKPELY